MKPLLSVLMLVFVAIIAAGTATTAQTTVIAQATPEPTDTSSAMPPASPMPDTSPMPASTPTTIDIKQGGTTNNSNGSNWLDKFNRNPGVDTTGIVHGGMPAHNAMKPMTKKMKPHPMPTKKP